MTVNGVIIYFHSFIKLMKIETITIKVLGLLMLAHFVYDAWLKHHEAEKKEGEMIKDKI